MEIQPPRHLLIQLTVDVTLYRNQNQKNSKQDTLQPRPARHGSLSLSPQSTEKLKGAWFAHAQLGKVKVEYYEYEVKV